MKKIIILVLMFVGVAYASDGNATPAVKTVTINKAGGSYVDSTRANFDSGTYTSNTQWWADEVRLVDLTYNTAATAQYSTTGVSTFISAPIDAGRPANWTSMNWSEDAGYGDELVADTTNGMVALWHMNETAGVIVDAAGENNGTYNGALYNQAGKFSGALGFDGSDDHVSVGTVGNVKSVEFWINDTCAADGVLELVNSTTYVSVVSSAIVATGFTSPTVYVNGSSASASLGSGWNHVAVTTGSAVSAGSVNIGEANGDYELGLIDEVAVYSRALSASEVMDHYRRGACDLKLQVRTGNTVEEVASGEWRGPGGYNTTYYTTSVSNALDTAAAPPNRYFQYKSTLSTLHSSLSPTLHGVALQETHYSTDRPAIVNKTGAPYLGVLDSFSRGEGSGSLGTIRYQISKSDTTSWYYYTGGSWTPTSAGWAETNPYETINAKISEFRGDHWGYETFYFKGYMDSNGAQYAALDNVAVGFAVTADSTGKWSDADSVSSSDSVASVDILVSSLEAGEIVDLEKLVSKEKRKDTKLYEIVVTIPDISSATETKTSCEGELVVVMPFGNNWSDTERNSFLIIPVYLAEKEVQELTAPQITSTGKVERVKKCKIDLQKLGLGKTGFKKGKQGIDKMNLLLGKKRADKKMLIDK